MPNHLSPSEVAVGSFSKATVVNAALAGSIQAVQAQVDLLAQRVAALEAPPKKPRRKASK